MHCPNNPTRLNVIVKHRQIFLIESLPFVIVFFHRSVKLGLKTRIPMYLGTCYRKRALVFGGHLHTVRSYFLSQTSAVAQNICQMMTREFIQQLGDALHFIHLEKLVHIEVSADSILVMVSLLYDE